MQKQSADCRSDVRSEKKTVLVSPELSLERERVSESDGQRLMNDSDECIHCLSACLGFSGMGCVSGLSTTSSSAITSHQIHNRFYSTNSGEKNNSSLLLVLLVLSHKTIALSHRFSPLISSLVDYNNIQRLRALKTQKTLIISEHKRRLFAGDQSLGSQTLNAAGVRLRLRLVLRLSARK